MRILELLALIAKLGPKFQQALPYIQQIIDAMSNIVALFGVQASAKPDPAHVAQLESAGMTKDDAEKALTAADAWERLLLKP